MNLDEGSENPQALWFLLPLCSASTFLGVLSTGVELMP